MNRGESEQFDERANCKGNFQLPQMLAWTNSRTMAKAKMENFFGTTTLSGQCFPAFGNKFERGISVI